MLVGGVVVIAGIILDGNVVLVIIGDVILGLEQTVQGKSKDKASQQVFDAIAPDIANAALRSVQMNPMPHFLDAEDTNMPLSRRIRYSGSGHVRRTYRGLTTELCAVRLTEVSEVQREKTGLWERNKQSVYIGQWMLYELGQESPTWLTIWSRERLDKLFSAKTIKAGSEVFDKYFGLSNDDETAVLRILILGRMERILALMGSSVGKSVVNLDLDGRVYTVIRNGHGFFSISKGYENPAQLRQRFAHELRWPTDVTNASRGV